MPTSPTTDRRRSRRRKPSQLVYLEFGRENGGMVGDVSEGGMRFRLINPVTVGQTLHFAVNVDAARRIEGHALMVWTDANGKSGGMSFAELSPECRETLRAWLAEIDSPRPATPVTPTSEAPTPMAPTPPPPAPALSAPIESVPAIPASAANAPSAQPPSAQRPVAPPPTPTPPVAPAPVVPGAVAPAPSPEAPPVSTPVSSAGVATPLEEPVSAAPPPPVHAPLPPQQAAQKPALRETVVGKLFPKFRTGTRIKAPVEATPAPAPVTTTQPAATSQVAKTPVTAAPVPPPAPISPTPSSPAPSSPAPSSPAPISPAKASPESPAASSDFPRPVTREDWIRAARENPVPAERAVRMTATIPTATATASPPAPAPAPTKKFQAHAPAAAPEIKRPETRKFEKIAERVDPLREFLRQPPDEASYAEELDTSPARSKNAWPISRVIMVLTLAAICGAAAAFAAIAYRQTLGESIIQFGEKISGEPRSNAAGNADHPSTEQSPSADSQSRNAQAADSATTANKPPDSSAPIISTNPATAPSGAPALTTTPPSDISRSSSQDHSQPLGPSPNTQTTTLASGREIVAGKPKRLAEDVSSLWLAVEKGDTSAEVQLANRYVVGEGVKKNCDQARVLLQAAARRGNELASRRLTELSMSGCR